MNLTRVHKGPTCVLSKVLSVNGEGTAYFVSYRLSTGGAPIDSFGVRLIVGVPL